MSEKSREKPYARTIPHPLFERLIVEDAMNEEKDEFEVKVKKIKLLAYQIFN